MNNGWAVAMTLLGYERGEAAATHADPLPGRARPPAGAGQERGVDQDPVIRQRLAWCYSKVQIMRYLGMRTLTQFLNGHHPGADGAIFKLYWSEYHQVVTELASTSSGADALVPTGRAAEQRRSRPTTRAPRTRTASWASMFLNAAAGTIYAGSSQIQRNIIGEMVLGLPKEPRADGGTWSGRRRPRA